MVYGLVAALASSKISMPSSNVCNIVATTLLLLNLSCPHDIDEKGSQGCRFFGTDICVLLFYSSKCILCRQMRADHLLSDFGKGLGAYLLL